MATGRLPDPNSAPVTAKGDLYTYSTVPAKLAVGNNGETLVADSSATTGLRWQGNYAAGKNKIINGDFGIWQRGTSVTLAENAFGPDRFKVNFAGGVPSGTMQQQSFTAGTAPVAGYEGTFFGRWTWTSLNSTSIIEVAQPIEDVRTFAGQTVTVSFWAKADSSRTIGSWLRQQFGSGGSANNDTTSSSLSLTTSWQRFSYTRTLDSASGKTIGSGSSLQFKVNLPAAANVTVDIWGVQVEAGNTATAFQTATGTLAGELAACQRYYVQFGGSVVDEFYAWGESASVNQILGRLYFPVKMRSTPTLTTSAVGTFKVERSGTAVTGITAVAISGVTSPYVGGFNLTKTSGFTAGAMYAIMANNDLTSYLGWSSEL